MQQELNRIKNKDLSKLDERLFSGLNKIQTIDSTIQNLGQFQQFLLQQITQFEQKSKLKNNDKQVTQVIEQNCTTLRESILRVGVQIQQHTSRLRMSHLSPANAFRSTGFQKWRATLNKKQTQQTEQKIQIKNQALQTNSKDQHILKLSNLKEQLGNVKISHNKLTMDMIEIKRCMKDKIDISLKNELKRVMNENIKLRSQNQALIDKNTKISQDYFKLQEHFKKIKQNQSNKNASQQKSKIIAQQNSIPSRKNSISNLQQHKFNNQNYSQPPQTKQTQYKSFMDKIKSDFSIKLKKNYLIQSHNQPKTQQYQQQMHQYQQQTQQYQKQTQQYQKQTIQQSSTFRQSGNIKDMNHISNLLQSQHQFRSVEITRDYHNPLTEKDTNVPKLLRRNSLVNHQHHPSITVSQQSKHFKNKLSIQQLNQQFFLNEHTKIKVKSFYQHDPFQSKMNNNTSSKKSNHDLMRKTKSNFFTNSKNDKENDAPLFTQTQLNLEKTTLINSKDLTNVGNSSSKKRSQSKQKLKIFSLL